MMDTDGREAAPNTMHKNTPSSQYMKATGGGRGMAGGPIGRNPYLNFLREFRKRNTGLSAVEVVRRGAQMWKEMPRECKLQYIEAAFYAPKKRKPRAPPCDHAMSDNMFFEDPDDGCCPRRRKKKRCPCAPKRRRRRCPRRRPKRRSCKRRRRRCG